MYLSKQPIRAIVIGASAGGIKALQTILHSLPADVAATVIIVLHLHPRSNAAESANSFQSISALPVKEAQDKEPLLPGTIYIAPSNYHLLIETDLTCALSIDEKVNFSRPSIDVLFTSAAEAFQQNLVGIILSGASDDGAAGLKLIKAFGGQTLVQTPESAEYRQMPQAALLQCQPDNILTVEEIGRWLADNLPCGQ